VVVDGEEGVSMTTDRTTDGVDAEPEEVEALLHNLCGFHLAERDPVFRYTVLTREQVLYNALADAIKRERGRALAELVERGHKLTEVAELTGLGTRQRVQRLIQLGAAAHETEGAIAVSEVQEASRQFDERLAAVEATLDEVVSGIVPPNEPQSPITEMTDEYDTILAKEPFVVEHFRRAGEPEHSSSARPSHSPSTASTGQPAAETGSSTAEVPAVTVAFDPLTADIDELTGMFEPTQVMPALSAAERGRTRTTSSSDVSNVEDEPWWRQTT